MAYDDSDIDQLYASDNDKPGRIQVPDENDPNYTVVKQGPFTFIYESGSPTTTTHKNDKQKEKQTRSAVESDVEDWEPEANDSANDEPVRTPKKNLPVSKVKKHKRTRSAVESDVEDREPEATDSANDEPVRKPKKNLPVSKVKKHKAEETATKNQEAEPAPLEISGHLWLETTTTVSAPGRGRSAKAKLVTTVDTSQRPAFLFTTSTTFNEFLIEIARSAQVPVPRLTITRLFWKHETPARGERKLLADEISYKAMLKSVQAKKGNPVIFFYLPKPIADEEPSISTVRSNLAMAEYNEVTATNGVFDGVRGQIDAMRNSYAPQRSQLEQLYPVGNHPLFPGKRIYSRRKEFWELLPLRLDVWASAIAAGRATYDAPPTSAHFTASTTIKPVRPEPSAPRSVFVAYHHYKHDVPQSATMDAMLPPSPPPPPPPPAMPPPPPAMHPPPPAMPPTPYFPWYSPYTGYPPPIPYPYYGAPGGHAPPVPHLLTGTPENSRPATDPPSAGSSPGVTTSHNVALDQFCAKYAIPLKDAEILEKIEYKPGNRLVEHFSEADWKDAGFSILGWRGFLRAHNKFCTAIKSGSF